MAEQELDGVWFDVAHLEQPALRNCTDYRLELHSRAAGATRLDVVFECRRSAGWVDVSGHVDVLEFPASELWVALDIPLAPDGWSLELLARGDTWLVLADSTADILWVLAHTPELSLEPVFDQLNALVEAGVLPERLWDHLVVTDHSHG